MNPHLPLVAVTAAPVAAGWLESLQYVGLGLLGGLILNVMPCVLPVLTMKVFHVIEHSSAGDGSSDRERRLHGLAYTGGVLLLFLGLAAAVIGLKAAGERVGWGMQFRNPSFVAAMTGVVFVFGLNALGVFEWNLSLSGKPGRHGYGASVVNGLFAALMSTPCSAPFLGTAATFALGGDAPWWRTLAMFIAIGLGLASPFLAVSFVPAIGKRLPRPGPWMETFKHLTGFTLLAAAVWLLRTLQMQVSKASANDFIAFLLVVAVALWGVHHFGGVLHSTVRRLTVRAVALGLTVLAGYHLVDLRADATPAPVAPAAAVATGACAPVEVVRDGHIQWAPFDSKRVAAENKCGRAVFLDYTAEWCANCKTNEKLFIETRAVRETLSKTGVLPMKVDMTNENEEMEAWLAKLGRSGIPAYVLHLPDGTTDLMPEAITTQMVVERLEKTAARFGAQQVVSK